MPDATLHRATVEELRRHCGPLFLRHHAELAELRASTGGVDVDWDLFAAIEAAGRLVCLVAWVGDAPVGYSIATFITNPLCRSEQSLVLQAVFVDPDYRTDALWHRIAAAVRAEALPRASRIVWAAPAGSAAAVVFERRCGPPRELCFHEATPHG